jgi:hypothetical protein
MAMLDLKQDKSHAQGVIVTIAILVEAIGVSLVALSFLMSHLGADMAVPSAHLNEGSAGFVILIAMIILFGSAANFAGRMERLGRLPLLLGL